MGDLDTELAQTRPLRMALMEGCFGLIAGAVIAVLAWMSASMGFNLFTDTVLQGLMLGMSPGLVAIVALALVYCAVGIALGYSQCYLFNAVAKWVHRPDQAGVTDSDSPEMVVTRSRAAMRRSEPTFGETIDHRRLP